MIGSGAMPDNIKISSKELARKKNILGYFKDCTTEWKLLKDVRFARVIEVTGGDDHQVTADKEKYYKQNVYLLSDIESYVAKRDEFNASPSNIGYSVQIKLKSVDLHINLGVIFPFINPEIIVSENDLMAAYNADNPSNKLENPDAILQFAKLINEKNTEAIKFLKKFRQKQIIKTTVEYSSAPSSFHNGGRPIDTNQLIALIKLFVEAHSDQQNVLRLNDDDCLDLKAAYILNLNLDQLFNALHDRFPSDTKKLEFLVNHIIFPSGDGKKLNGTVKLPATVEMLIDDNQKKSIDKNLNSVLESVLARKKAEDKAEKERQAKKEAEQAIVKTEEENKKNILIKKLTDILKLPEYVSVVLNPILSDFELKIKKGEVEIVLGTLKHEEEPATTHKLFFNNSELTCFSAVFVKRPSGIVPSLFDVQKQEKLLYAHVFACMLDVIENGNHDEITKIMLVKSLFSYIEKTNLTLDENQLVKILPFFTLLVQKGGRFTLSADNALALMNKARFTDTEKVGLSKIAIDNKTPDRKNKPISGDDFLKLIEFGFGGFHNMDIGEPTKQYTPEILKKIRDFRPSEFDKCKAKGSASKKHLVGLPSISTISNIITNENEIVLAYNRWVDIFNKSNKDIKQHVSNLITMLRQKEVATFLLYFRIEKILQNNNCTTGIFSSILDECKQRNKVYLNYQNVSFENNFDFKKIFNVPSSPTGTPLRENVSTSPKIKTKAPTIHEQLNYLLSLNLYGAKFNGVILPDFILNLMDDKEKTAVKLAGKISGDKLHDIFVKAKKSFDKLNKNKFSEFLLPDKKMSPETFNKLSNDNQDTFDRGGPAICARGIYVSGNAELVFQNDVRFDYRNAQFETLTVKRNGLLSDARLKGIKAKQLIIEEGIELTDKKKLNPISLKNFNEIVYNVTLKQKNKANLPVNMLIKDGSVIFSSSANTFNLPSPNEIDALYAQISKEYHTVRQLPGEAFGFGRINALNKAKPALSSAEKILSLLEYAKKYPDRASSSALYNVLRQNFSTFKSTDVESAGTDSSVKFIPDKSDLDSFITQTLENNLHLLQLTDELKIKDVFDMICSEIIRDGKVKNYFAQSTPDVDCKEMFADDLKKKIKVHLLRPDNIKIYLLKKYAGISKKRLDEKTFSPNLKKLLKSVFSAVGVTVTDREISNSFLPANESLENSWNACEKEFNIINEKIISEFSNGKIPVSLTDVKNLESIIQNVYKKFETKNNDLNIFIQGAIRSRIKSLLFVMAERSLLLASTTSLSPDSAVIAQLKKCCEAIKIPLTNDEEKSIQTHVDTIVVDFKKPISQINNAINQNLIVNAQELKSGLEKLLVHVDKNCKVYSVLNLLLSFADEPDVISSGQILHEVKNLFSAINNDLDLSVFTLQGDKKFAVCIKKLNDLLLDCDERRNTEKQTVQKFHILLTTIIPGIMSSLANVNKNNKQDCRNLLDRINEVLPAEEMINKLNLHFDENKKVISKLREAISELKTKKNALEKFNSLAVDDHAVYSDDFKKLVSEEFVVLLQASTSSPSNLMVWFCQAVTTIKNFLNNEADLSFFICSRDDLQSLVEALRNQYAKDRICTAGNTKDELIQAVLKFVNLSFLPETYYNLIKDDVRELEGRRSTLRSALEDIINKAESFCKDTVQNRAYLKAREEQSKAAREANTSQQAPTGRKKKKATGNNPNNFFQTSPRESAAATPQNQPAAQPKNTK